MNYQQRKPIDIGKISGFPELLPNEQAIFDEVVATIRKHYTRAGAVSIVTPLVERKDVLSAKAGGEINKEIYGLTRLSDSDAGSAEELGLKFDLTVPLARYVARHQNNLPFPFRRQQIDRVHRGERPQHGRYREFVQADLDIVGRNTLSITTDAEPPAVINDIFSEMKIGDFAIRINNRKILHGYFEKVGVDPLLQGAALATIDKAEGPEDKIASSLQHAIKCDAATAEEIIRFIKLKVDITNPKAALDAYRVNDNLKHGIDELVQVAEAALALGVPAERLVIDLSVARGLDYYTGTVYETRLADHPDLGSICSGGRYDDLASRFTSGRFPGVGISIGVSRLVPRLIKAGVLSTKAAFSTHVLVARLDEEHTTRRLALVQLLRRAGVPVEPYFEEHSLGDQLRYAVAKGYGYVVIMGAEEIARNVVKLRDLNASLQDEVRVEDLLNVLTQTK